MAQNIDDPKLVPDAKSTAQDLEALIKDGKIPDFVAAFGERAGKRAGMPAMNTIARLVGQLNEADRQAHPDQHLPQLELFELKNNPAMGVVEMKITQPSKDGGQPWTSFVKLTDAPLAQEFLKKIDPKSPDYTDFHLDHAPTAAELENFLRDGETEKFKAVFHDQVFINMDFDTAKKLMEDLDKLNTIERSLIPDVPKFKFYHNPEGVSAELETKEDGVVTLLFHRDLPKR